MTDTQLYLAIGVPIVSNALIFTIMLAYINTRFSALDKRLDDLRDLWRAELRRVEEVLDARLKHIEEERRA
jgi:hypothetical protein